MMKLVHAAATVLLGLVLLVDVGHAASLTPVDAGGGALSPPVARGDYLYVGTGATLTVWNMSRSRPVRSTSAAPTGRRRPGRCAR